MNYDEWAWAIPEAIVQDVLWKVEAYRLSMFLADVTWKDVSKLVTHRRTVGLSDQLYRSVGSISANIAEGYSRRRDQARFYEYALGSARESRDGYYKGRSVIGER